MSVRDFQDKKRTERLLFSVPILLGMFVLVALMVWAIIKLWVVKASLEGDVRNLHQQISEARARKTLYEEKRGELDTPEGLDREARFRFNLTKPGEEVVVFVDSDATTTGRQATMVDKTIKWIQQWFGR
jgi:cell division protein FtsB